MSGRESSASVLMIVPCYHESARIGGFLPALCDEISKLGDAGSRILVVDDGSEPAEKESMRSMIAHWQSQHPLLLPLMELPDNLGKGGAVYAAWRQHGKGSQWLGFVDADGSCPASEAARLILLASSDPSRAMIASRVKKSGHRVVRRLLRHLLGRFYSLLVSGLLRIPVHDTQCGLKLVPAAAFEKIEPLLTVNGFAFDAQLICALLDSGCPVAEEPIDWHEAPGGKIRLLRDSARMLRELIEIRSQRAAMPWREITTNARSHSGWIS